MTAIATMPTTRTLEVRSNYFDRVLDPAGLIRDAQEHLADVDFDTFVATGLSGTCAATVLAHALGKNFLILRKPDDLSTHSSRRAVGRIGERFVFLDDFVSSGATRNRVLRQLVEVLEHNRGADWDVMAARTISRPLHKTTFVGEYHYSAYMSGRGEFFPPGSTSAVWPPREDS